MPSYLDMELNDLEYEAMSKRVQNLARLLTFINDRKPLMDEMEYLLPKGLSPYFIRAHAELGGCPLAD